MLVDWMLKVSDSQLRGDNDKWQMCKDIGGKSKSESEI